MAYTNYIHRTPSSNGNRQKFTISTWVKRPEPKGQGWILTVDSYPSGNMFQYQLDTASYFGLQQYHGNAVQASINTSNLLKDPNAWYHLVLRVDTTQSTAADRVRLYINGTEATYNSPNYPSQNFEFQVNHVTKQSINSREDTSAGESLYFSHYYLCDGYSYAPTEFGETDSTTGQWKIKTEVSVSYGTNGFWIFKDGMNLSGSTVQDQSGQGNNLTLVGSSIETQDTPSNSFCTLNFANRSRITTDSSGDYLKQGNTTFDTSSSNGIKSINTGTIGVQSGKYYWEYKVITNTRLYVGITQENIMSFPQPYYDETDYSAIMMNLNGAITGRYTGSAIDEFSSGTSNTTNDIIGLALDMDNKAFYIHKNGTYISNGSNVGVPTSGSSRTGSLIEGLAGSRDDYIPDGEFIFPVVMDASTSGVAKAEFNFGNGYFGTTAISSEGTNASGNGKFEYDVPAGYTALCTKGLNA